MASVSLRRAFYEAVHRVCVQLRLGAKSAHARPVAPWTIRVEPSDRLPFEPLESRRLMTLAVQWIDYEELNTSGFGSNVTSINFTGERTEGNREYNTAPPKKGIDIAEVEWWNLEADPDEGESLTLTVSTSSYGGASKSFEASGGIAIGGVSSWGFGTAPSSTSATATASTAFTGGNNSRGEIAGLRAFILKDCEEDGAAYSSNPVRYADGMAKLAWNDFDGVRSGSGLLDLGVGNRTWASDASVVSPDVAIYVGMGMDWLPFLEQNTSRGYQILAARWSPSNGELAIQRPPQVGVSTTRYAIATPRKDEGLSASSGHGLSWRKKDGTIYVFNDFDTSNGSDVGKLRRIIRSNGQVIEYDRATSGVVYATTSYDATPDETETNTDDIFERVSRTVSGGLVTQVAFERKVGPSGTWTPLRTVTYSYHNSASDHGPEHSLKSVTVYDGSTSASIIKQEYYRWYETSDASNGHLKMWLTSASVERAAEVENSNLDAIDDADLKEYAENYFEYDSEGRVTTEIALGAGCGCGIGGGGQGRFTFSYYDRQMVVDSTTIDDPGFGTNYWVTRTTETLPDSTNTGSTPDADNDRNIVYTNSRGQIILIQRVEANGTSSTSDDSVFNTWYQYDEDGRQIMLATPAAITGKSESFDDLVGYGETGTYLNTTGKIQVSEYFSESNEPEEGLAGYLWKTFDRIGSTNYLTSELAYTDGDVTEDGIFYVASRSIFKDNAGEEPITTEYEYDFHTIGGQPSTLLKWQKTTHASIKTTENGADGTSSPSSYSTEEVFDLRGNLIWERDAEGYINYHVYDELSGTATSQQIDVAPSEITAAPIDAPEWDENSSPLALTTTRTVDPKGRVTSSVSPDGVITYTRYDDSSFDTDGFIQVRRYVWDAANGRPVGPVTITRDNPALGYREVLTYSWPSSIPSGWVTSNQPNGVDTIDASGVEIKSMVRQRYNVSGQTTMSDAYVSLPGAYSTSLSFGTQGIHFLRTEYEYEGDGNLARTLRPDGTIERRLYDVRNVLLSVWKGTDDEPTSGYWSLTNMSGANLKIVSENVYDANGNATESRAYYSDSGFYATNYDYDGRDRLIGLRNPNGTGERYTLDNLGRGTTVEQFVRVLVNVDGSLNFTTTVGGVTPRLSGKTVYDFDDQGRLFRTTTYEVSPTSGTPGHTLTTNYWYDRRGNLIKTASPTGVFQKNLYDGTGRLVASYVSYDVETLYADADDVSGDTVLSQQNIFYYGNRAVVSASYQRSALTGSTTGALTPSNSFAQVNGSWYDVAGRVLATANYGRDTSYVLLSSGGAIQDGDSDGIPNLVEAGVPSLSSSLIRSKTQYDAAGRVEYVFDNADVKTYYEYDLLGRRTKMVENYVNGEVTEIETSTDRTTEWKYDKWGRLHILRAVNPLGADTVSGNNNIENQDTQYYYASDFDRSWVSYVVYPDSDNDRDESGGTDSISGSADFDWHSSGTDAGKAFLSSGSGADHVTTNYDRLGRVTSLTDQRGTLHTYSHDTVTGQLRSDVVTTPGTGVDGAIRAIGYGYDDLGRIEFVTSYDDTDLDAIDIVNQIKLTYDGWGNVIKSQQDHDSAVDTVGSTTPDIEYTYADGASGTGAKYVRLSKVTYPNGREVFYLYGAENGTDDKLSRVYEIGGDSSSSNSTYDARYSYIGVDTIIREKQTNGNVTLDYDPSNNGSLSGLDTFGRVIDHTWTRTPPPSSTLHDKISYEYDANSNRTSRIEHNASTGLQEFRDQYYYDGLNRLEDNVRSQFDSEEEEEWVDAGNQSWTLDNLGNWRAFSEDVDGDLSPDMSQTRTHNKANEIGTISGSGSSNWADPAFDDAGNMTSMPQPGNETSAQGAVYDAWNHLISVSRSSTTVAQYEFDGLGRRISATEGGDTEHSYFNENWQVLQTDSEDLAGPTEQNIWSLRYVDALVRQDKRIDDGSTANAFGEDGIAITNINDSDYGRAIAVQSDGKIVVVGSSASSSYLDVTVVRYLTDGSLDTGFGGGDGIFTYNLSAGYDEAYGVAIDSNGKIVLGGRAGTDSFVMRLTSAGALDTSFGASSSGYKLLNLDATSWFDSAYAMTLDSNGKILLAGSAYSATADFVVARVLANGSGLDTTFGSSSSGVRVIDFGSGTEIANAIDIDSSGNIIVAGESGGSIAIARLTSSGALDTTYSGDGKDTILPSGAADAHAQGVTIDANDKIIFSGYRGVSTGGYHLEMLVARRNIDGSADTTFSGDGFDYYAGSGTTQGFTVNLQTDGKIVVGGLLGYEATLWRYNTNGTLDTTFDNDGVKGTNLSISTSSDRWVAVGHNGTNLFVGGFTDYNTTNGSDFAVMKLNAGVGLNQTLYFQQDANFNVTSITDANGKALERYRYSAYGVRTVLNADFTVNANPTLSDYGNSYGHQGGKRDLYTGLILFRHREYHATLGRWVQRDPIGYVDGLSLYEYVASRVTGALDPSGYQSTTQPTTQPTTNIPPGTKTPTTITMDVPGAGSISITAETKLNASDAAMLVAKMSPDAKCKCKKLEWYQEVNIVINNPGDLTPKQIHDITHSETDEHGGNDPTQGWVPDNGMADDGTPNPVVPPLNGSDWPKEAPPLRPGDAAFGDWPRRPRGYNPVNQFDKNAKFPDITKFFHLKLLCDGEAIAQIDWSVRMTGGGNNEMNISGAAK